MEDVISGGTANRRRSSSSLAEKLERPPKICIECGEKEAMPKSIYCGEECIGANVARWIANMNKDHAEPIPSDARMTLVDTKKRKVLTGKCNERIIGSRKCSVCDDKGGKVLIW